MTGTLIWSSMDHDRSSILTLDHTDSATRFFHKAFSRSESKRLTITKNKYYYAPSDEYKKFVVRFKGVKKES
jgi:hypothetical protein